MRQTRRDLLAMIAGAGVALNQAIPCFAQAADSPAKAPLTLKIETATEQNVAAYGSLLGKPFPTEEGAIAFRTPVVASWRQALFDAGLGGEVEIVWVDYKITDLVISRLEQHHLTQQAVVPLTGKIMQIVALSRGDGAPDPSTIRAFRLSPGTGLNMGRDVWHTTRSTGSTCLMLTRGSTSIDILKGRKGNPLTETLNHDIVPVRLPDGAL